MATEKEIEIAQWMYDEFSKFGTLRQRTAANKIRMQFGEEHLHRNKNRNWAINKPILDEFAKLNPDERVWSRSRQLWRTRRPTDPEGTRMVK